MMHFSYDHWSHLCRTVLKDHLRFSHVSPIPPGCRVLYAWPTSSTLSIDSRDLLVLCAAGISLLTGCPPVQHFVRMAHSLAHFHEPHSNPREIHSSIVGAQVFLVSVSQLCLLLLTVPTNILPSEFWGETSTCPQSPGLRRRTKHKISFFLNKFSDFYLFSSNGRPSAAWQIQMMGKQWTGYEMFVQLPPPRPVPLQVNAVEGRKGEGEKHFPFSSAWKGSEKAFFPLRL